MKTIKFISAIALTLGMAACDSYDLPNPPGQNYPNPDGYFENSGLVLKAVPADQVISLKDDNAANKYTKVAEIEDLVNFPEGYTLEINMELSGTDNFAKETVVSTTIDGNDVTINPDVLNGAIQSAITKAPGTYDVYARFIAYATMGSTRMRLGGLDATYGDEVMKIATLDPAKVIEQAYYLVPCDANGAPQFAKAMKMNNTGGDNVNAYDNPEFALKFDVEEGTTFSFMVAPQSAMTAADGAGLLGGNPAADGLSGRLGEYPAAIVPINGSVFITINMEADSYNLSYAFDCLYPFTGSLKAADLMLLYTDNYINYTGVCRIQKQLLISSKPSKTEGVIFRQDPDDTPTISEDGYEFNGLLTTSEEGTMVRVTWDGLYYANVNLVQQTYKLDAIQSLAVIGNGNGWSHDTSFKLTHSKDYKTWTATGVEIDGEFKLATNGNWDGADFGGVEMTTTTGGHVYQLKEHGGNMSAPKGTYDVTIDFSTVPYTLTLK